MDGIKVKFASPIVHDGRLYVCDDVGKLYCLDAKTGKQTVDVPATARTRKGSPVLADGKIYIPRGRLQVPHPQAGGEGLRGAAHAVLPQAGGRRDVEINGSPAVANGRVYFMTSNELYCIGKKDHKAKADPIPPQPTEAPADKAASRPISQVVPADVVLHPGESVRVQGPALRRARPASWRGQGGQWELAGMRPPKGCRRRPRAAAAASARRRCRAS